MNIEKLKEFILLAKETGVSELKYESSEEKYSVSLGGGVYVPQISPASPQYQVNEGSTVKTQDSDLIEITSPFVGTYYKAASPDSAPYVKVGDRVSPGHVLCIVEAMKIMNEIESEISGEIVEICVENEAYIEFGEVLFKIRQ